MDKNNYEILNKVDSAADLKRLNYEELRLYCNSLREYIIEECSVNPGHLASSLGVVELTAALHYTYNSPHDKLVWDVGHQTYPHKIITGRREAFKTKRTKGGISGFPRMEESEYDSFGAGHASTSISAALGFAKAAQLQGLDYKSVAVIGDGSMTGGLAFEGLNNAGASNVDMLVILNDNRMAIDRATGALNRYLLTITISKRYNRFKHWLWQRLSVIPKLLKLTQLVGGAIKQGLLHRSNLFESLNFRYFGPVDGHDVEKLVKTLKALREIEGVKLLHVSTVKGCGYAPAEQNNRVWHAPGKFNAETGERIKGVKSIDKYQDVFGQTLLELALKDDKIIGITPAMLTGCSMDLMMKELPSRCFDVGIAEGHAVTYAAATAAAGLVPFCNIYSSFMQRAYDNVIHDVAIQNLPVILCLDRGGLVGEDGATHHGVFDMAYFSTVPNLVVSAPRNELELRRLIYTAYRSGRPFVIRYPRGEGEGVVWRDTPFEQLPIGRGERLRKGSKVAVLSVGTTSSSVAEAIEIVDAQGDRVAHYDMRYVKPLDLDILKEVADSFDHVITVEDGAIRGGVGEAIAAHLLREGYSCSIVNLGIEDRFIEHGTLKELHAECGIDAATVAKHISEMLSNGAK
ncbi:MAG: 1-deoxy-D-xylulose-5-phosphate synthase [Rikenellaceae bacterium]